MENNEENDLFYFESAYLALKGNRDYSEVLKKISLLEAQRTQAIQDLDTVINLQKEALKNPTEFINKIKNGEDLGVPHLQDVAELTEINWSKYNIKIPEELLKQLDQEKYTESNSNVFRKPRIPKHSDNTSTTFNKPWTSEEQKKLEELLITYPPEAIETRRYKKIAAALENRTVKQVTSRLQKYFLKLYKAGLPIPGRIPKTVDKRRVHRHQRNNSYLYKPSTFFPEIPVAMTDDDFIDNETAIPEPINENKIESENKTELQLKIDLLRRVRLEKEKEETGPVFTHVGFKCDYCSEEPIIGSRWHCYDCTNNSFDLCSDCVVSQLLNSNSIPSHPLTHNLIPIQNDQSSVKSEQTISNIKSEPNSEESDYDSDPDADADADPDSTSGNHSENENSEGEEDSSRVLKNNYDEDYVLNSFVNDTGKYNYLDPNFLPE